MRTGLRRGLVRAPTRTTFAQATEEWLIAAKSGVVRTRSGDAYKPSALRSYRQSLNTHVLPELGRLRVSAVSRVVVQDLIDEMVARGAAPSTVRNAVLPIRVIYRRAVSRTEVAINPTEGLALPAVRGRRERIARPEEAAALIAAVPARDQAIWATAFYAGLRLGELRALRWQDVDFDAGVIRVERGWDRQSGPITPKSRAGVRRVPLGHPLRAHLAAHRLAQQPRSELVFGGPDGRPFSPAVANRAKAAWSEARLATIGLQVPAHLRQLHDCRRHQRKGAVLIHGPFEHHDHP